MSPDEEGNNQVPYLASELQGKPGHLPGEQLLPARESHEEVRTAFIHEIPHLNPGLSPEWGIPCLVSRRQLGQLDAFRLRGLLKRRLESFHTRFRHGHDLHLQML